LQFNSSVQNFGQGYFFHISISRILLFAMCNPSMGIALGVDAS